VKQGRLDGAGVRRDGALTLCPKPRWASSGSRAKARLRQAGERPRDWSGELVSSRDPWVPHGLANLAGSSATLSGERAGAHLRC
jgi:hypothetical protein